MMMVFKSINRGRKVNIFADIQTEYHNKEDNSKMRGLIGRKEKKKKKFKAHRPLSRQKLSVVKYH